MSTMRGRDTDIAILRAVPMLAALPAATIEALSSGVEHAEFAPGQVVFEQGDQGAGFYVIESGHTEVIRDGHVINTLGPGNGFGEVALLGDRPRTATIRASTDLPLRVTILARTAFLTAVTGYPVSATAGQAVLAHIQARDAAKPPQPSDGA